MNLRTASAPGPCSGEGAVGKRERRAVGHKLALPRGREQQGLLHLGYLRGVRHGGSQKEGLLLGA